MGRRKLEMKKITNNSSRLVTFSKRRSGLFKKANEISTLCSAEVAIIVFSPGGKPFSFGKPNVEKLVRRFQRSNRLRHEEYVLGDTTSNKNKVRDLNQQLMNLEAEIEMENKRCETLQEQEGECAFEEKESIEDLEFDQLVILKKKLQGLLEGLTRRVREIEASNSLLLLAEDIPPPSE